MKPSLRVLVACLIAVLFLAGTASSASAGEYDGNGEPVPGGVNGASICSFSGLDIADELETDGEPDDDLWPGQVQSYGQAVRIGLKDVLPSPGIACRGN